MTDRQIDEALGSAAEHGRLWEAVVAMLEQYVSTAIDDACIAGLTDSNRQYEAGRLALALEIRNGFQERMRAIKTTALRGPGTAT